jgi:hypothetical protein
VDVDIRCGHCGREGLREPKGQVVLDRQTKPVLGDYPWLPDEVSVDTVAQVDVCKGCGKPSLLTYVWVDEFSDPEDDLQTKQLYPEQRDLDQLPSGVQKRYRQMLEIQHEPDLFAVRAGTCLEAVCADQGVPRTNKQKDLADRLDALVERGDIPESLAAQAHIVREYRNIGGHDAAMKVKDGDEGLLDYLYWGPVSLEDLTHSFQLRKRIAEGAEARRAAGEHD